MNHPGRLPDALQADAETKCGRLLDACRHAGVGLPQDPEFCRQLLRVLAFSDFAADSVLRDPMPGAFVTVALMTGTFCRCCTSSRSPYWTRKLRETRKTSTITNPNIGASVDQHFLTRELQKAEEAGEESLRGFLAKHLNVEIGLALQSDRWAGADHWQKQGRPGLTLDQVIERSDVLTVGIDGGGLDDLMGLAVVGRDADTREWLPWTHAWAHPSVLERRKAEAPRLRDFAKDGDVTLAKSIGDDVLAFAEIAAKVYGSGKMDKIGVDPAGIGAIVASPRESTCTARTRT